MYVSSVCRSYCVQAFVDVMLTCLFRSGSSAGIRFTVLHRIRITRPECENALIVVKPIRYFMAVADTAAVDAGRGHIIKIFFKQVLTNVWKRGMIY